MHVRGMHAPGHHWERGILPVVADLVQVAVADATVCNLDLDILLADLAPREAVRRKVTCMHTCLKQIDRRHTLWDAIPDSEDLHAARL